MHIQTNQERVTCRVCANYTDNGVLRCRNFRNHNQETFRYGLCSQCRSLSLIDVPEKIGPYYENYYSMAPFPLSGFSTKTYLRRLLLGRSVGADAIFALLLGDSYDLAYLAAARLLNSKNDKILDVGCGSGRLVFDLVSAGYTRAEGIDPYLEETTTYPGGATIHKRKLEDVEGKYDLIMLHHVFEHLEDQLQVLQHLRQRIEDSGTILIRIPNVDSYAFRKYGCNWYGIQPPVHYCLPSLEGMRHLAMNAGLQVDAIAGENIPEFWLHSHCYALDIADYHEFGTRTFLEGTRKWRKRHPAVCRSQRRYFHRLNRHVKKNAALCDWIGYRLSKTV